MTIDDWRARYDGLNAEVDRLRAEVERLQADIMNVQLNRAMLVVQRDAAQAWEARAVEALRKIAEGAASQVQGVNGVPGTEAMLCVLCGQLDGHDEGCPALAFGQLDAQPALDWLAQQRREAAAWALEEFADDAVCMEKLITCNIFDLRSALRTRAAAIRAGEVGNE